MFFINKKVIGNGKNTEKALAKESRVSIPYLKTFKSYKTFLIGANIGLLKISNGAIS